MCRTLTQAELHAYSAADREVLEVGLIVGFYVGKQYFDLKAWYINAKRSSKQYIRQNGVKHGL